MNVTINHENRKRTRDVHPAIGIAVLLWTGLCVGLPLWLVHPTPEAPDAGSRAYTVILIYFGVMFAKHTMLGVLTFIGKRDLHCGDVSPK